MGWGSHAVLFNHNQFFTHSTTVFNRGLNRPGGPPRNFAGRGAYARSLQGFRGPAGGGSYRGALGSNRVGGNYNRPNFGYRAGANRPGESFGRPNTSYRAEANRFGGNSSRPNSGYRAGASFSRPNTSYRAEANRFGGNYSRPNFGNSGRQAGAASHFSGRESRFAGNQGHFNSAPKASAPRGSMNHPTFAKGGGGHGGGHPSGGHSGGHHHG